MDDKYKRKMSGLVADSAFKVYGCHSHAGEAYIGPLDAVHIAAVIIGAAQSEEVLDLIRYAASKPRGAVEHLRQLQASIAEEIGADRQAQMRNFAEALKTDRRQ